jgi:GNAT superfamily N-acetyltransferase
VHHVPDILANHLVRQLGSWPPGSTLDVVGSPSREQPGWDGEVHPLLGVSAPGLGAVLSVGPLDLDVVTATVLEHGRDPNHPGLARAIPAAMGLGDSLVFGAGIYRWTEAPAATPDTGEWVEQTDPRLPDWLRPFSGGVLAHFDGDVYVAGVGIKDHDSDAEEIAVGTEPAARGRGLARLLVATAAREILRRGAIPLYLHVPSNIASARVAEAVGFSDHGWRALGLWPKGDA